MSQLTELTADGSGNPPLGSEDEPSVSSALGQDTSLVEEVLSEGQAAEAGAPETPLGNPVTPGGLESASGLAPEEERGQVLQAQSVLQLPAALIVVPKTIAGQWMETIQAWVGCSCMRSLPAVDPRNKLCPDSTESAHPCHCGHH